MEWCILQTFVGLALLPAPGEVNWKPATPMSFLQDASGKIVRLEPAPQWTAAAKHPGHVAAAVLGKPERP